MLIGVLVTCLYLLVVCLVLSAGNVRLVHFVLMGDGNAAKKKKKKVVAVGYLRCLSVDAVLMIGPSGANGVALSL